MDNNLQQIFFSILKEKCNPNISLVNEIADILDLSNDSAYRRLRGETALSLDEAVLLANHFSISVEEMLPANPRIVRFTRATFNDQTASFEEYLNRSEEFFKRIANAKTRQGIYAAKEIPIFHHLLIPGFGQFRLFYWLKSMRSSEAVNAVKFDFDVIPDSLLKKATDIAKHYYHIPFTEIWNEDTANAAIRQIDYFYEAGWIAGKPVALQLCEHLYELIKIIQQQAATSQRWFNGKPISDTGSFELYNNELVALDNSMMIRTDEFRMSMIIYNSTDYIMTDHSGFCDETENYFSNQLSKSMLLSGAAEKERNKFFKRIYNKIDVLSEKIKKD